ncbi:MAG: flagellar hook-length control protein FliK [Aquabacterium sp.]|uniref:flagellar hook-length control protein FliK n=1 Tax=Aquabacterium sp. TaxID=1872578 RepID=UPI00121C6173|nr:flagellar hook-length control protein FliK [Aquabacterium sp.]TAK99059.1 MAG: flagellar hook-length control protein FliK [Aquabacterium sp.]
MATPIKSTTASANAPGVNGVSPAINDLLARFGAQGDGQSQQAAFSQWMDKHAIVSSGATASEGNNAIKSPAPAHNGLSASAAEQAMLRARQQAAMATRPVQTSAQAPSQAQARVNKPDDDGASANSSASTKSASVQAGKNTKSADKATKSGKADGEDKAENAKDDDSVNFTTALGDGSAVVRELTPPSTIQPGDSAGMMAWLASLTHGDLAHGKAADAATGAAGDSTAQTGAALTTNDGSAKDAALLDAKGAAAGAQGAVTLDNALWQNVSASAATQVEALMGQSGKSLDGRADGDPLAGVLPGSLTGASLGNPLEGKAAVRHESATLPTPVNSPDFAQALAEKVSMWVGSAKDDGTMTAELHLNPAEMGPINVKISLDGQSAQVDFAAAALETRKAIEASLPMLSSALSDVGLNMTGGDVSSQTAQQQFSQGSAQAQGGTGRAHGAAGGGDADAGADPVGMRPVNAPRPGRLGGLDLYA